MMEAEEALAVVREFAGTNSDFAEAWDKAVLAAADQATARVTGALMSGNLTGSFGWEASIPCPADMDADDADKAYRHAVQAEVMRRLNAMPHRPGGLGPVVAADEDPQEEPE
jgi:hypothetical protein